MKKTAIIVSLVLVLVLLLGVLGCAKPAPTATPTPTASPKPSPTASPSPSPSPTAKPSPTATATSAPVKAIEWSWVHLGVPDTCYTWGDQQIPGRISQATNGQLKINLDTALVKADQVLYAVRDGAINGGEYVGPYFSAEFTYEGLCNLPFLFAGKGGLSGYRELMYALDNYLDGILEKELLKNYNSVLLAGIASAPTMILSKKPIRTVDDFKGLKFRAFGLEGAQALQALGASCITMPIAEALEAFERGMMDAIVTDLVTMRSMGFYQKAKYISTWPVSPACSVTWVANKASWDKLPDNLKPVVKNTFFQLNKDVNWTKSIEIAEQSLDKLKSLGVEVIVPSDTEMEKARKIILEDNDIWGKFIKRAEDRGYRDTRTVLSKTVELVREYRQKNP